MHSLRRSTATAPVNECPDCNEEVTGEQTRECVGCKKPMHLECGLKKRVGRACETCFERLKKESRYTRNKEWAAKNPEKIKDYRKRYVQTVRDWRKANEEKIRQQQRQYREDNRERLRELQKAHSKTAKYKATKSAYRKRTGYKADAKFREANREKIRAKDKAFREANREKIRAYNKKYRETRKQRALLVDVKAEVQVHDVFL